MFSEVVLNVLDDLLPDMTSQKTTVLIISVYIFFKVDLHCVHCQ